MKIFCDYALIDPITLCNLIESISSFIIAMDYDIDEDTFEIDVDTLDGELTDAEIARIREVVKPYYIAMYEA